MKTDYMLGQKISLNKFKSIKVISSTFSGHEMKLEINYRKKNGKGQTLGNRKKMLLKQQWVNEEIKDKIRKQLQTNENINTTFQNLWDAAKAVLRGKFISIQSYLKKQETSQINNLTFYLKQLEKEEQKIPKVSRRKEIIKRRK